MTDYLVALATGSSAVFSWPGVMIPVAGTLLAMTTSFLPGIGTSSLAALLMIATITWEPQNVLLLFGALTGGATFMGSVTAIMFNIPGSAQSTASMIDGHPLARNGLPKTALACSAAASAFGSLVGVLILILLLPFIRSVLLEFGPLERVLLAVWGLATLVALPNSPPLKATVMALLGFLFAMIGTDPQSGSERWTFGTLSLIDGLNQIAVLVGLFTFTELIGWTRKVALGPSTLATSKNNDSVWRGISAVIKNASLSIRCSVLGTLIGIVPGVGGTVASFVAYGHAANSAKSDRDNFGKGDIRGVIAPESANDAKDGGALFPAIAFGLPGSESGVILVAVFALHGLVPGPEMLSQQLPLTFTLIAALLFSNILTSVIGLAAAPQLSRLSNIRVERLALPVMLISLIAIAQLNGQMKDVYTVIVFGLAGYFLKTFDWPRIPFVVAFVLADFLESNLSISLQLIEHDRLIPTQRPISIALFGMLLIASVWATRKAMLARKRKEYGGRSTVVAGALLATCFFFIIPVLFGKQQTSGFVLFTLTGATLSTALIFAYEIFGHRRSGYETGTAEGGSLPNHSSQSLLAIAVLAAMIPAAWLFGFLFSMAVAASVWVFVQSGMDSAAAPKSALVGLLTLGLGHAVLTVFTNTLLESGLIWKAL